MFSGILHLCFDPLYEFSGRYLMAPFYECTTTIFVSLELRIIYHAELWVIGTYVVHCKYEPPARLASHCLFANPDPHRALWE